MRIAQKLLERASPATYHQGSARPAHGPLPKDTNHETFLSHSAVPASAVLAILLAAASSVAGQEAKPDATWPFAHPADPFTDKAVLDLRYLNEKEAGESGFLKRTPDGNGFALGNGKPVRLWAVGSDVYSPRFR